MYLIGWRYIAQDHINGTIEATFEFRSQSRDIGLKRVKNERFRAAQKTSKMALTPISQEWKRNLKIATPRYPESPTPFNYLGCEGGATVFSPASRCHL